MTDHRDGARGSSRPRRLSTMTVEPSSATDARPTHDERDDEGRGRAVGDLHDHAPPPSGAPYTSRDRVATGDAHRGPYHRCRLDRATGGRPCSRCGMRQRSSAPIHQSSVHPRPSPITTPTSSTVARAAPRRCQGEDADAGHRDAVELGLRLAQHERRHDVGRSRALVEDAHRPARRSASRRRARARARARPRCSSRPRRPSFISATISSSVRPCPSSTPTRRLRLLSLVHVATRSPMPGEAGERQRLAAERDAEAGELGEPARDERGLRVVAVAETRRRCRPRSRSRSSARPRSRSRRRRGSCRRGTSGVMNSRCSERGCSASPIATTDAVGWPSATSRARFGPVSTPMRSARCSREHVGDHLGHAQHACPARRPSRG